MKRTLMGVLKDSSTSLADRLMEHLGDVWLEADPDLKDPAHHGLVAEPVAILPSPTQKPTQQLDAPRFGVQTPDP